MKTKFSKEVLDIANQISTFYLEKSDWDYEKCNEEIEKLKIQNIVIGEDVIEIHLCRPGLLIGKHGENINMIQYDPVDFFDY